MTDVERLTVTATATTTNDALMFAHGIAKNITRGQGGWVEEGHSFRVVGNDPGRGPRQHPPVTCDLRLTREENS